MPFIHCWQEVSFSLRSHDEMGRGAESPPAMEPDPSSSLGHCLEGFKISSARILYIGKRKVVFK